jgi:hypothetical protein
LDFGGVDSEIGTIHSAQIAATALFRMNHMRRMVTARIKCRREREDFGWTKLNTEAARFAALHDDRYTPFGHGVLFPRSEDHSKA